MGLGLAHLLTAGVSDVQPLRLAATISTLASCDTTKANLDCLMKSR